MGSPLIKAFITGPVLNVQSQNERKLLYALDSSAVSKCSQSTETGGTEKAGVR
jgi:hypothetical protein